MAGGSFEVGRPQRNGSIHGLPAMPSKAGATLPTVLVVYENRGPNPYIEDVAKLAWKRTLDSFNRYLRG